MSKDSSTITGKVDDPENNTVQIPADPGKADDPENNTVQIKADDPENNTVQIKADDPENNTVQIKADDPENNTVQIPADPGKADDPENNTVQIKADDPENNTVQIKADDPENNTVQIKADDPENNTVQIPADPGKADDPENNTVQIKADDPDPLDERQTFDSETLTSMMADAAEQRNPATLPEAAHPSKKKPTLTQQKSPRVKTLIKNGFSEPQTNTIEKIFQKLEKAQDQVSFSAFKKLIISSKDEERSRQALSNLCHEINKTAPAELSKLIGSLATFNTEYEHSARELEALAKTFAKHPGQIVFYEEICAFYKQHDLLEDLLPTLRHELSLSSHEKSEKLQARLNSTRDGSALKAYFPEDLPPQIEVPEEVLDYI